MTKNEVSSISNRDLHVSHTVSAGFRTLEFHAHDHYEFLYFLEGEVQYYIEDRSYYLMPGDLLIIPPGRMHRPVVIEENVTYDRVVLWARQEFCRALLSRVPSNFVWRDIPPLRVSLSQDENAQVRRMIEDFFTLENNEEGRLERECVMTLFLLRLDGYIRALPEEENVPGVRMQQIIHFINAHFTEPLSLDDIAERFFISKYHLLRQFKAYTKSTPHGYIIAKRILLAQGLLRQDIPPQEVAETCGFGSYAGFYQTFTQNTGMSPTEYVKQNKEKGR